MKLDLIAIEKLCPVGLTPLGGLRAFVSVLVAVIRLGIGSVRDKRSYAHMLVQHRKTLREQAQHNQSLKIKAWVKQCPQRIAWVRSIIGEAAIRSWIARLRAAYISPRWLGDEGNKPGRQCRGEYRPRPYSPRPYSPQTGKAFALARLSEVEKLLPFRPRWPRNVRRVVSDETGNVRHAVRLTSFEHSVKPQKPVRFFPSEIGVKIRVPEIKSQKVAQKYIEAPPAQLPENPPRNLDGPNPGQKNHPKTRLPAQTHTAQFIPNQDATIVEGGGWDKCIARYK